MNTQAQGLPAAETAEGMAATADDQALETTAEVDAQDGQQEEPEYVTRADMERMQAEIIRRMKQSERDRSAKIEQQLTAIKNALTNSGAAITPQQERALRQQVEAQFTDADMTPDAPASATPPEMPEGLKQVMAHVEDAMKGVGVYVSPRDPEYARIQKELDNPNGSLAKTIIAAGVAAEAKKARLQQSKQNAQARTMSGGGQTADPTDISGITDSKELYRIGSQRMAGGRKP